MYIAQRARLLEKIYATQYIARLQHAVAAHGHEHGSLPRVGMNGGQPHADGQPPAKKPQVNRTLHQLWSMMSARAQRSSGVCSRPATGCTVCWVTLACGDLSSASHRTDGRVPLEYPPWTQKVVIPCGWRGWCPLLPVYRMRFG